MNVRKGSLIQINDKALGILAQYKDRVFKVERIKAGRREKYAVIAGGVTIPFSIITYMGPQKKGKKAASM